MTSIPQTEHHFRVRADKAYTNFKWSLEDFTLLRDHYNTITSPESVIHNTDGKTCTLEFKASTQYTASVDIQFPMGIQYHAMKTSLSFLDEKSVKLITIEKIFRNSDTCCTLNLGFVLTDATVAKYLRNDTLTLFFELTIAKSVLPMDSSDAHFTTDICKHFKVMLDNKDFYDVTFVIAGKQLYAHKVILAASSEVFRAMFTTEMKEQGNNTVEIVDIDATVFEVFLTYMYTGHVTEIGKVVNELIVVADKYQVMNLKKLCECYMSDNIDDDTAITYLLKAYQLSCTKLQKKCINFIRINIHVLHNSDDLAKISKYPWIVSKVFKKKRST